VPKIKWKCKKYQAGFQIKGLWIAGFYKISLQNLMFPFKVADSLWKAKK
jgi:UDP-N-acetylglucosamine--N-acetylmuramyl-(pentapeptide) pyrophosphoryl-undecaprenol N-acetylglucosamine transferase